MTDFKFIISFFNLKSIKIKKRLKKNHSNAQEKEIEILGVRK